MSDKGEMGGIMAESEKKEGLNSREGLAPKEEM